MCLIKHHAIKAYGEAEEEGHLSLINFPDRSPNCGRFAVLDRQPHRLSCRAGRLNIPEPGIEQPKTLTHACTHTHTHTTWDTTQQQALVQSCFVIPMTRSFLNCWW